MIMKLQPSEERYIAKFPTSKALYEKALGIIPSGVTHDARFVKPFPIYITHGIGSHIWDVDGYEYIDYFGGHGALMLGHAHPSLIAAVNEQIVKGTQWAACHELEIEWAELIKSLIPSAESVQFVNSGTEANMLGIRLARAFTNRNKIVRFKGQMGGWYDALVIGNREPVGIPPAVIENTITIPINNEEMLKQALKGKDVAVLVCEPAGAYSGVTGIAPFFYRVMREMTKQYQTLLLFDEVVTGFRYAPGGVQAAKGVVPDLTTLGKNVTGGLPGAGAVVGRADIMDLMSFKDVEWDQYKRVYHPGTFSGNPLCAAAGIATLKILATGEPQKQANRMTTLLREEIEGVMKHKHLEGCAYNEFSCCHIYFGSCEMREKCDRVICLHDTKVRTENVGHALHRNLALHGVHTTGRGVDLFLSAVHNKKDIAETIKAFELSIDTMINEGTLKGQ
jgi:glutamate-1-semialdehyde 2,1-aminomutase